MKSQSADLVLLTRAAELLGVSRWALWRSVRAGEIPALQIGKRYFLSMEELRRIGNRQTAARRRAARHAKG